MNLFNLLPVNPLDGGRVVKSLTFSAHGYVGLGFLLLSLIGMIVLIVKYHIWLFMVLLIVAVLELSFELFVLYKKKKKAKEAINTKHNLINAINQLDENTLDEETKMIVEEVKKDLDTTIAESYEKPKMSLKQIVFYATLYLLTCFVFLELMTYTIHLPGCKEAFDVFK